MTPASHFTFSLGQCATLACLLEAAAPKAGNVHRSADFEDLTLYDFLASAVTIAPAIEARPPAGVGRTAPGPARGPPSWPPPWRSHGPLRPRPKPALAERSWMRSLRRGPWSRPTP